MYLTEPCILSPALYVGMLSNLGLYMRIVATSRLDEYKY